MIDKRDSKESRSLDEFEKNSKYSNKKQNLVKKTYVFLTKICFLLEYFGKNQIFSELADSLESHLPIIGEWGLFVLELGDD